LSNKVDPSLLLNLHLLYLYLCLVKLFLHSLYPLIYSLLPVAVVDCHVVANVLKAFLNTSEKVLLCLTVIMPFVIVLFEVGEVSLVLGL
jgi:hypothetical protein